MGTPGSGRKRTPIKDRFSAEDDALNQIAREAEARLAAKRAARAEARDIRMRELERQQKELDEKSEKTISDGYSRPASRNAVCGLSAATLASLGGTSSRRGSSDTGSLIDPDVSFSELRDSMSDVEEKYKKAMVSNAQLDNEKTNLIYQVDTLKDIIEEMEEQMAEFYRENEEKTKELERQKHSCSVLQHKLDELKEGIRQRDELIEESQHLQQKVGFLTQKAFDLQETINWKDKKIGALERQKEYFDCIRNERDELREEMSILKEKIKIGEKHGLVVIPDVTSNGDLSQEPVVGSVTVVSQESAQMLESTGEGPLDIKITKLVEEKEELLSQVRKLKLQLEEEEQKTSKTENMLKESEGLANGSDLQFIEMQREASRQLSEYKFKLSKAEQDMVTLEQNVVRLEGQVTRYKSAAENAERIEDELKAEKRKLQRELRTALDKIEEMEVTNSHLVKRLEKMKANRNALLSQQ